MRKLFFVLATLILLSVLVPDVSADHRSCTSPLSTLIFPLYLEHCDLRGQDLSGEDLSDAILNYADLSYANLSGADLSYAFMIETQLVETDLSSSDMGDAFMPYTNLTNAVLTDANLRKAVLGAADLTGADLTNANLNQADLRDVTGLSNSQLRSAKELTGINLSGMNLSGFDLTNLDLSGADLSGADLSGADLRGTILLDANLTDAVLNDADLRGTVLSEVCSWGTGVCRPADLGSANLSYGDLRGVVGLTDTQIRAVASWAYADMSGNDVGGYNLLRANLSQVNLSGADLYDTYLYGAILYDANLTDANFGSADLTVADLREADLTDANLELADLIDADLTDANLTQAAIGYSDLNGANLSGAILVRASLFSADLTGATLIGADLTSAHLGDATFTDANLSQANLQRVILTGHYTASFFNTTFDYADLTGAFGFQPEHIEDAASMIGIILTGHDLSRAQLSNQNLSHAILQDTNLENAEFDGASLRDANLTNATLRLSDLTSADLTNANLSHAVLSSVAGLTNDHLRNATSLIGVSLYGLDLTDYNLSGLDLTEARMYSDLTNTDLSNSILVDAVFYFYGDYDLTGANFTNAMLIGADLAGAPMTGTIWHGADLSAADLSFADLRNAAGLTDLQLRSALTLAGIDFSGNDLEGFDLRGTDLGQSILNSTNLSRANLSGVPLASANLAEANLSGALLTGCDVTDADFNLAIMYEIDLKDTVGLTDIQLRSATTLEKANLSGKNLNGFDLNGVDLGSAELTAARLIGADLSNANLNVAVLDNAYLNDADLSYANLNGAMLEQANLNDAVLDYADLRGVTGLRDAQFGPAVSWSNVASLIGVNLSGHDFNGWQMEHLDLNNAFLMDVNLLESDLYGVDFTNANLSGSDIRGARLSTVTWNNTICPDGSNSNANTPESCYQPPWAREYRYYPEEDTAFSVQAPGVLANDSYSSGRELTVSLNGDVSHGSLLLNPDGSFDYDPTPDFCGYDSFTYLFNDGRADSNVVTIFLTVRCVNDAPVVDDDYYATDEDTPLEVSAPGVLEGDLDVENDSLTTLLDSPPANGALTLIGDGSFEFSPDANYCGPDSFTYTAGDGKASSDIATVQLDIICVNDRPAVTVAQNSVTVDEGQAAANSGTFEDLDSGDQVTIAASIGSIIQDSGNSGAWSWSFTPADGPVEGQEVIITATDLEGVSSGVAFDLVVSNVAPVVETITPDANPITENDWVTLAIAFTDPGADSHTVVIDWGDGGPNTILSLTSGERSFSASHQYPDDGLSGAAGGAYTIQVTVTDDEGASGAGNLELNVNNALPKITSIIGPVGPIHLNDQPVTVSVSFSDAGPLDTHSLELHWGDGTIEFVSRATSPSLFTHSYANPDAYTVTALVEDDDGGTTSATYEFIVIYYQSGGFVSGGGWFHSEAGWCQLDDACAAADGRAHFGFVSEYKQGASTPTGNTRFRFRAGNLIFQSDAFDWLVVNQNGTNGQFKGSGTINGQGSFEFMIWARDGDPDTFRIRIWYEENGVEVPVYDNGFDLPISAGKIMIHK